jgi:crotonobetaine/carnitine-CoA ligase
MVPRYIRFMEDLPKTETHRVKKPVLQSEGVTSDTWDEEKERGRR